MRDVFRSRWGSRPLPGRPTSRPALTAAIVLALATLCVSAFGSGVELLAQALPGAPRNLRLQIGSGGGLEGWPTAGADIRRSSHSSADVAAVRSVTWYRPIEAFISSTTELITGEGRVYVATTKGLVVLDAEDGDLVCRFDTELPVSTPTVESGVVYVPGFDRTLYALNSSTCGVNWAFTGARGGFSANPLVADGRVFIGSRDGNFYALNASNGAQVWTFATNGPVMQSAAYEGGVLYFASMDMHGYALDAASGALVWRTPQKLPGEQYTSWWPVVYGGYVVWSSSPAYKNGASPGSLDAGPKGVGYDAFFDTPSLVTAGTVINSSDGSHGWPAGSTVMSTVEGAAPSTLQAWVNNDPARRLFAIVNRSNGVEPFYLPLVQAGIKNGGQMHPPVFDGTSLIFDVPFQGASTNIARARPAAWKTGTPWLRMVGRTTFAADEPLHLSMSNGRLFGNLCCDREARTLDPDGSAFWHYSEMLDAVLPSQGEPNSYDPMWAFYDGAHVFERLQGYYRGATTSRNGVYHVHGAQNPLVPLAFTNASAQRVERIFTHRSNTIIALGPNATKTYLPLVAVNHTPPNRGRTQSAAEVRARLEREVQRMVDPFVAQGESGFLRPAYVADGGGISNTIAMPEPDVYFRFPADTVYSLAVSYPHLASGLQAQVRSYLAAYWQRYFVTNRVRVIGWNFGTQREAMVHPPVVAARMAQLGDLVGGQMPQRLFYAAWRYAQIVPSQAASIYNAVRPSLIYPPPTAPLLDIARGPGIYNDYIAGYQGFLNLYDMAGTNPDPGLRANVASALAGLVSTRLTNFAKDHPWQGSVDNPSGIGINQYVRKFNCTRNFLYMTPALGQAMRSSPQASTILGALDEYQYLCSYWFAARDGNSFQEASAHHIFDSHALFLAKAYVAAQSQPELSKWLDAPWVIGDLYHIQNLAATMEAAGGSFQSQ